MTGAVALSLHGATKAYSGATVLQSIDLEVREGEFVSLLGPSGCGKTTTLNIIAGFVSPDSGDVLIAGRRVNDIPPYQRDLGMVFQGHALFPHMTCFENVAFGLRMRKLDEQTISRRVAQALDLVHLTGFETRFPRQLSGGQQQRVGLARALVVKPRVLLLDEPLSNLDAKLRRTMQSELRAIHTKTATTMIYVTHDQEEALTLSDRIAVMNGGRIEQLDTPEGIYGRPRTRFVADFIGSSSFVEGEVVESRDGEILVRVGTAGHVLVRHPALAAGTPVQLGIRSDRVHIASGPVQVPALSGRVTDRAFAGAVTHLQVDLGESRSVVAHLSEPPAEAVPGSTVSVSAAPGDWIVLQ
jgi:putative spermidine/putrescine transport system ATP-binding protein